MLELLRNRRTIRKYEDKKIPEELIEQLKEAALRSPTSRNRKEWKFWFVQDKKMLNRLSDSKKSGAGLLKDAALAVVIGADSDESDVWIEDCSIAAINIQMAAQSLGLGSCWVQTRERFTADGTSSESFIQKLLFQPKNIRFEAIIAIGFSAEERESVKFEQLDFSNIYDV